MQISKKYGTTSQRKSIWGWAIYDWANSAFATTVMAGFFPIFFKQYWSYGSDVNVSTAQLGMGNALASLIVAVMAPILGSIADRGAMRKKMLIAFAYLGVLMTAALFWVQKGQWGWAILIYGLGIIGFSGANIFNDALLPLVSDEKDIDTVSSLGYALGYLGGGLLFLINVLMTLMPQHFGLPDAGTAIRLSFLTVALWWGSFTLFTIFWVREPKTDQTTSNGRLIVIQGMHQFFNTFKELKHLKTVFTFLLAYWFYIDGVDTIIRMAVDYGLSLGFKYDSLIVALLIVQFVGFPAALAFGVLGQKWGVRKSIYLAIGMYMLVTVWATMMTNTLEFYGMAIMIGLVQGGIQALSRSYFTRLIPKSRSAEFFGFYNMLGKFAAILGPALIAIVSLLARNMLMPDTPTAQESLYYGQLAARWSIASILILFAAGAACLYFVDEEKGRREAAYLDSKSLAGNQ